MTFKRVVQSYVDWVAIAKRAPKTEIASFSAFKAKSGDYLKKMSALPAEPPKIDWPMYKNKILVPGLVDDFKRTYEAFKIPYPEDVYTEAIDCYEQEIIEGIEQFKAESDAIIKECEERICQIEQMLPLSQMTFEDAAYEEPQMTIDLDNKPSFWPHQEDDYVILDEPKKEEKDDQRDEPEKVNVAPAAALKVAPTTHNN